MSFSIEPESIFLEEYRVATRNHRAQVFEILASNQSAFHTLVEFRVDVPWLHIDYGMPESFLRVPPRGSAPFRLIVDDASPDFPEHGPVNLRVGLHCTAEGWDGAPWSMALSLCFESIEQAPEYQGVFAIDFGTTNSSCAVIDPDADHSRSVPLEAGGSSVASLIFFESVQPADNPAYHIGSDAAVQIKSQMPRSDRYIYSAKRSLGTDAIHTIKDLSDDQFVQYSYDDICRFIIERLIQIAEERLNGRTIKRVVATYPTMFSQSRVEALRRIFVEYLGFEEHDVRTELDEASAAALWFLQRQIDETFRGNVSHFARAYAEDSAILAYDFGGGTIDTSVVKVHVEDHGESVGVGARYEIEVVVLGGTGDPLYGGDNVTLEVFKLLKWRIARQIATQNPDADVASVDAEHEGLADQIERARERLRDIDYAARIDTAIQTGGSLGDDVLEDTIDLLVPTKFAGRKGALAQDARERFNLLWTIAEDLKKKLSQKAAKSMGGNASVEFELPTDFNRWIDWGRVPLGSDVSVSMEELDRRIESPIRRTIDQAHGLFNDIAMRNRAPNSLHAVLLAGQSSHLPVVRRMMENRFGRDKIHFEAEFAKSSVAMGACLAENLERGAASYRFKVKTLVDAVPYEVGYKIAGKGIEQLFELGAPLPQSKRIPEFDGQELRLLSNTGLEDEPVYLGKFDFTRNPAASRRRRGVPTETRPQPPVETSSGQSRAGPPPAGPPSAGGGQQRSGSGLSGRVGRETQRATVTVHFREDRSLVAERNGQEYPLLTDSGSGSGKREIPSAIFLSGRY